MKIPVQHFPVRKINEVMYKLFNFIYLRIRTCNYPKKYIILYLLTIIRFNDTRDFKLILNFTLSIIQRHTIFRDDIYLSQTN